MITVTALASTSSTIPRAISPARSFYRHISPIIVAADYSSIPEQTRVAVWGDQDTYTVGSKGKMLSDTEATTDITQAKVNEL